MSKQYKLKPLKELPTKTKIKIPTEKMEKLIEGVKPAEPTLLPPKKPRRGRPPKHKKPTTFNYEKYHQSILATTIDDFLIKIANKMLKGSYLTQKDCMIGEALLYTADYYGWTIEHPLIILTYAVGIYAWNIASVKIEAKTGKLKEEI